MKEPSDDWIVDCNHHHGKVCVGCVFYCIWTYCSYLVYEYIIQFEY